jgi:hypothetical protein
MLLAWIWLHAVNLSIACSNLSSSACGVQDRYCEGSGSLLRGFRGPGSLCLNRLTVPFPALQGSCRGGHHHHC